MNALKYRRIYFRALFLCKKGNHNTKKHFGRGIE